MLLFMIVLGLTGCGGDRSDKEGSGKNEPTIHSVAKKELPKEVKSKMDELTDSKKEGEATVRKGYCIYLLVALGERSTGGYSVDFTKAELADGKLHVYAKEKTPSKDSAVTQAITYPVEVGYVETDSAENIKEYQFHVEKDSKGDKDRSKRENRADDSFCIQTSFPWKQRRKWTNSTIPRKKGMQSSVKETGFIYSSLSVSDPQAVIRSILPKPSWRMVQSSTFMLKKEQHPKILLSP